MAALVASATVGACSMGGESASRSDTVATAGTTAEQDLRERAAELLPEVERLSGLPAREALNLGLRSRADLELFLQAELAEQFADERVANVVRVYARLGLVPDTLDLEPLLARLLLEQVAGFYDPASDTLFIVEGVARELMDGVLVHEMVHAIQDQYVDLDSLVEANRGFNDASMAAQAALEGHATFVMYEWALAQMTGTSVDLTRMPPLGATLGSEALSAAGLEMPELQQAPAVIQEQLLFPYIAGLEFVQIRWGAPGGRIPPLGESMPSTTEQVLHPGRWGAPEAANPAPLAFGHPVSEGWTEVYRDGLGEADIRVLFRELLGDPERAEFVARGWDGDTFRLVEGPGGEALIWISRWDSGDEAAQFATAADRAFRLRYAETSGRTVVVERLGERTVRVVDAPEGMIVPDGLLVVDGVE